MTFTKSMEFLVDLDELFPVEIHRSWAAWIYLA